MRRPEGAGAGKSFQGERRSRSPHFLPPVFLFYFLPCHFSEDLWGGFPLATKPGGSVTKRVKMTNLFHFYFVKTVNRKNIL
ncbi:hypothetical protein GCWU000341_02701 [Oribacterium sp. oral taxon 078 str. F0262]|nr:hypothetical protein GCWU000341_02701 [Oribacterium sp. oral taxon 078 str. F0262]